jgi:hypothetical protein
MAAVAERGRLDHGRGNQPRADRNGGTRPSRHPATPARWRRRYRVSGSLIPGTGLATAMGPSPASVSSPRAAVPSAATPQRAVTVASSGWPAGRARRRPGPEPSRARPDGCASTAAGFRRASAEPYPAATRHRTAAGSATSTGPGWIPPCFGRDSASDGGGGIGNDAGPVSRHDSVVIGNTAGNCSASASVSGCSGRTGTGLRHSSPSTIHFPGLASGAKPARA